MSPPDMGTHSELSKLDQVCPKAWLSFRAKPKGLVLNHNNDINTSIRIALSQLPVLSTQTQTTPPRFPPCSGTTLQVGPCHSCQCTLSPHAPGL
jgi:hypothetical protein